MTASLASYFLPLLTVSSAKEIVLNRRTVKGTPLIHSSGKTRQSLLATLVATQFD